MYYLKIQRVNYMNYIFKLKKEEILPDFTFNKISTEEDMKNFIDKYIKIKKIIKNITYEKNTVKNFCKRIDFFLLKNKKFLSKNTDLVKIRDCRETVQYMKIILYQEKYDKIIEHEDILSYLLENNVEKKILISIFNEHKLFIKYINTPSEEDLLMIMQKNNIDNLKFFNAFYSQCKFNFNFLIEKHKIRNIDAIKIYINNNSKRIIENIPQIFNLNCYKNLNMIYILFEQKEEFNKVFFNYIFNALLTFRIERGKLLMVVKKFKSITIYKRIINLLNERSNYRVYDKLADIKINLPLEYIKGNLLLASFIVRFENEELRISLIQYLILCKEFNFKINFNTLRLHHSGAYTINKIYAEYKKYIAGESIEEKFTGHFKNLHNYLSGKNKHKNLLTNVQYENKDTKKNILIDKKKIKNYKMKSIFMRELKQKKIIKMSKIKIDKEILNSLLEGRYCKIEKGKVEYIP